MTVLAPTMWHDVSPEGVSPTVSILRVVPDPAQDPEVVGLSASSSPSSSSSAGDPGRVDAGDSLQWFSCAEPAVASNVRTHLLTVLNDLLVDTDTIADAMVLVSELVTNVTDHTASDDVGIRVSLSPRRVVVAVAERETSDPPPGGRLLPGPADGPGSGRPLPERGRGLRILDAIAAEWGFVRSEGRTTTWFALRADVADHPRPPDTRRFPG